MTVRETGTETERERERERELAAELIRAAGIGRSPVSRQLLLPQKGCSGQQLS